MRCGRLLWPSIGTGHLDKQTSLTLAVWMLRCKRSARSHAMAIHYYRDRDHKFTFANVFLAIAILGISSAATLFGAYWTYLNYGILVAAILNVAMSALQYIRDYGSKAIGHERASGLYATLNREIELLALKNRVDEAALNSIRERLDVLAITMSYPPKRFRDQPADLTSQITELEAELTNMLRIADPN